VESVAVDQTTGDVYVYDAGTSSIYKFSAAGVPLEFTALKADAIKTEGGTVQDEEQLAIDSSSGPAKGDLYLAAGEGGGKVVFIFNSETGAELGKLNSEVESIAGAHWGEPCGVAVDPNGNVYVSVNGFGGHAIVDRYTPTGKVAENSNYSSALFASKGFGGSETCNLTVDSEGAVYLQQFTTPSATVGAVRRYQALEFQAPPSELPAEGALFAPLGPTLAADPKGNNVYLDTRSQVEQYSSTGELLGVSGASGAGALTTSLGVGISDKNGDLYAAGEEGKSMEIFGPAVVVPDVNVEPVKTETTTTATLPGKVNPDNEGNVTACHFEYATAEGAFTPAECAPAPPYSGNTAVSVSANLTGLEPNTTYKYRLAATNTNGTNTSAPLEFTTAGPPKILSTTAEPVAATTATLQGSINTGDLATTYHFEYGPTESYGTSVPAPEGTLSAGFEPDPVDEPITGLTPGSTYHYRLVATNSAGPTVDGPDQTLTTEPYVHIEDVYATEVTSDSAELHTVINPKGSDTHYYFRYGTETELAGTCNEHASTCIPAGPGEDIGSGNSNDLKSIPLAKLSAGVTYHYRVVAANSEGITESRDQAFTTQSVGSSPPLPDGRQDELVSPPSKNGAEVVAAVGGYSGGGVIQATEDGRAITYLMNGPPSTEPPANSQGNQMLSVRGPEGWGSQDITTHLSGPGGISGGQGAEFKAFSSDLSLAVVKPYGPSSLEGLTESAVPGNYYVRDQATGEYHPLVLALPASGANLEGALLDATPTLSDIVFSSPLALVPPMTGEGLYDWTGGHVEPVSVLPDGSAASQANLGRGDTSGGGVINAVSSDGARAVWEAIGEDGKEHLFDRDLVTGETTQLDAGGPETGEAEFLTASSDGGKVYFKTNETKLTGNATGQHNLYQYDFTKRPGERLSDLTVDAAEPSGAEVQGIVGASEDGASVYFVAAGVLAPGASPEPGCGHANEPAAACNFYVWHDGTTRFVATLAQEDERDWSSADLRRLTARVSPGGRFVAFMSVASLTGYDNVDARSSSGEPHRDAEVYLYDESEGRVVCVSCNPTGARPEGQFDGGNLTMDPTEAWKGAWVAAMLPGWTPPGTPSPAWRQSRYLSDEGRLFFDSSDALVPYDTNGHEDVYEFEPYGVGSCRIAAGCVSLISAGAGNDDSVFDEATPSGNDVFFSTKDRLAPQDIDDGRDIYDAHVCTTDVPCLPPVAASAPPCSSSDGCRAPIESQLSMLGVPASSTFSGAGNVTPAAATSHDGQTGIPTRASKLAKALKACRRKRKRARSRCEAAARKHYGPQRQVRKRARRLR